MDRASVCSCSMFCVCLSTQTAAQPHQTHCQVSTTYLLLLYLLLPSEPHGSEGFQELEEHEHGAAERWDGGARARGLFHG